MDTSATMNVDTIAETLAEMALEFIDEQNTARETMDHYTPDIRYQQAGWRKQAYSRARYVVERTQERINTIDALAFNLRLTREYDAHLRALVAVSNIDYPRH